jgi:hypothetical protein
VSDVSRALEQIAQIHEQLAKTEIYRGWRSLPVACSGLVGLTAAGWQTATSRPVDSANFIMFWVAVGAVALLVGCCEIGWHYLLRATETERRRSRQVIGQFLPALVAGALVTGAFLRAGSSLTALLPGLWAVFFGVGIFSARPYIPRASGWVALYYWTAGLVLLWFTPMMTVPSTWTVGGTFGVGQLLAAGVLYWNLERGTSHERQEA